MLNEKNNRYRNLEMSRQHELLSAFEQGDLGKFQELLEFVQADNIVQSYGKTLFEIILSTPDSAKFIKLCIDNGAEFYMVKNYNTF